MSNESRDGMFLLVVSVVTNWRMGVFRMFGGSTASRVVNWWVDVTNKVTSDCSFVLFTCPVV